MWILTARIAFCRLKTKGCVLRVVRGTVQHSDKTEWPPQHVDVWWGTSKGEKQTVFVKTYFDRLMFQQNGRLVTLFCLARFINYSCSVQIWQFCDMSEFLWWNQTRLEDCGDFLWDKSPAQFGIFTRTIVLFCQNHRTRNNCAKRSIQHRHCRL